MDYLEQGGYCIAVAGDGTTALAQARHERPDLVVLDLNLPGMDGLDVCRALRCESDVPIIMLTARIDETDRLIGLELGTCECYATTPRSTGTNAIRTATAIHFPLKGNSAGK
jgi:DNA-binding response OmpR family regulator